MTSWSLKGSYFPFWKIEARTLFTQVMAKAAIGFFFLLGFEVEVNGEDVVVVMGTVQEAGRLLTLVPSEQVPFWM